MNMIIVGSVAGMKSKCVPPRKLKDVDVIGEYSSAKTFASSFGSIKEERDTEKGTIFFTEDMIVELEDVDKSSHTNNLFSVMQKDAVEKMYASPEWLRFMKESHKYKKDSPHFLKTLYDLHYMRRSGIQLPEGSEDLLMERERLTYTNKLPNLNVGKEDFFKKEESYNIYDHDSLHIAVAIKDQPAYTYYMKDGSEVMTSKEKFFSIAEEIRLLGVYEESCVLALERSQIPFSFKPTPESSFRKALEKVATSITSGYFREYAYDNYFKVMKLYNEFGKTDYVDRFNANYDKVKRYVG